MTDAGNSQAGVDIQTNYEVASDEHRYKYKIDTDRHEEMIVSSCTSFIPKNTDLSTTQILMQRIFLIV